MGNIKQTVLKGALGALLLSLSIGNTAFGAQGSAFMKVGGLTSIPVGHYNFCKSMPQECSTRTHYDARVKLDGKNWQQLLDVNNWANTQFRSVTDAALYGTQEHWTYPVSAGDCEDYVLIKRRELIRLGWPEAALLITVVRQRNGEGHAVLTVRTDRGDLILDNLEQTVKLWSETPYQYIKRQSKNHTGQWEKIQDTRV